MLFLIDANNVEFLCSQSVIFKCEPSLISDTHNGDRLVKPPFHDIGDGAWQWFMEILANHNVALLW